MCPTAVYVTVPGQAPWMSLASLHRQPRLSATQQCPLAIHNARTPRQQVAREKCWNQPVGLTGPRRALFSDSRGSACWRGSGTRLRLTILQVHFLPGAQGDDTSLPTPGSGLT